MADTAAQIKYYCIDHPASQFHAWCQSHAAEIQSMLHPHVSVPSHVIQTVKTFGTTHLHDLERLHKFMDFFNNSFVFWSIIVVAAYMVGRVGLTTLWSDITSIVSKVKNAVTTAKTGATAAPAPAAAAPATAA